MEVNEHDALFDYKNSRNPSALYRFKKIENMQKEQIAKLSKSHPKAAMLATANANANANYHVTSNKVSTNSAPLSASVVKFVKSNEAGASEQQSTNFRLTKTPRTSLNSDKNNAGDMEIKVRSLLYRSTSSASFDGPIFDSINEIEKIRQQLRDEFNHITNGGGVRANGNAAAPTATNGMGHAWVMRIYIYLLTFVVNELHY